MSNTMPAGGGTAPGADANAAVTAANSGDNAQGAGTSTGDDAKKECNKPAPEGADYDDVREASPSGTVRRRMPRTTPTSRCPVCQRPRGAGWPTTTGSVYPNYSADHIVPLKDISKMKGFACLSKKDQKKIANFQPNFLPVCFSCNSSRQETAWNVFGQQGGHSVFGIANDMQQLVQTPYFQQEQEKLRNLLQDEINKKKWNKDP